MAGEARSLRASIPWAIFAVALLVRLAYLWQASHADPLFGNVRLIADSQFYEFHARAVAAGDLRPDTPFFLAPLYAYVMGALYALVGVNLMAVKILQCLLGAASCVLVYGISRRVFDDRVGTLAGGALAVYGLHVFYSGVILPTVLVVFSNLLFLWILVGIEEHSRLRRLVAAGFVLGLAIAAKPNAILMLPATLAALFLADRASPWRLWAIRSTVLAVTTLATITPFSAHNYAASGEIVFLTTTSGRNLLKGNGPEATGSHVFLSPETRGTPLARYLKGDVDPVAAVDESRQMSAATRRYMAEHPGRTAALWLTKLGLLFNATELSIRDQFEFAKRYSGVLDLPLLSFGFVVPLGLVGMLFAWRSHPRSLFLYGALAAQLASFLPLFVLARYRLVAVACLVPFAAWAVYRGIEDIRGRNGRAIAGLAIAWVLALGIVHVPLPDFPRDRGFADQWSAIGDAHVAAGRYPRAARAFTAALDATWLQPDGGMRELETRVRLSRARLRAGDVDSARGELAVVLQLAEELGSRVRPHLAASIARLTEEVEESARAAR